MTLHYACDAAPIDVPEVVRKRGVMKIPCVTITRPKTHGLQSYVAELSSFSLQEEMEKAKVGDSITLTYVEFSQKELDSMEEFGGW